MSIPPHATKPVPHTQCGLAEWALVRPTRTLCLDVVSLLGRCSPRWVYRGTACPTAAASRPHSTMSTRAPAGVAHRPSLRCVSAGVHLSARPASQYRLANMLLALALS